MAALLFAGPLGILEHLDQPSDLPVDQNGGAKEVVLRRIAERQGRTLGRLHAGMGREQPGLSFDNHLA